MEGSLLLAIGLWSVMIACLAAMMPLPESPMISPTSSICTIKSHRLVHPSLLHMVQKRAGPPQPGWPSFAGTAVFVGASPSGRVNVWYDPLTGLPGKANAQALVTSADRILALNDGWFGQGGQVNVIVFAMGGSTNGQGGADHMGCDFATGQDIEVCASFGQDARVSALFEAEYSECSMGGNLCGVSTGEALSRWCAMLASGNALTDFASAPDWYNGGKPNWVDQTQPTDGDYPSIGCGMAFISWLLSRGFALPLICQTMVKLGESGTLARLYASLTANSPSGAWPAFLAAVNALPGSITSDDPFGGAVAPTPPPVPAPTTSTLVSGGLRRGLYRVGSNGMMLLPSDFAIGIYEVVPAGRRPGAVPVPDPVDAALAVVKQDDADETAAVAVQVGTAAAKVTAVANDDKAQADVAAAATKKQTDVLNLITLIQQEYGS